jgi:predicted CoA-binding protein
MTSKNEVTDFFAQRTLAIAGVSRNGKKFGNAIVKSLKEKGYTVYIIHPSASTIDGEQSYRSIGDLPEPVGGLVIVLHPSETEKMVREAAAAGITRIWMQVGAESASAIEYCTANGISVIHGQCMLMFAEPAEGIHRMHRAVLRFFGKLPK